MSDSLVQSKGEQTRDKIFFKAGRLFADRGFSAVSIDEIIEGLGIAKGTMYQYFDGKKGLLDELLLYSEQEIRACFDSLELEGKGSREVIREILFKLSRLYTDSFDMVALGYSCSDRSSNDSWIPPIVKTLQECYVRLMKPFLSDFRIDPDSLPFVVFLQGEYVRGHLDYLFRRKKPEDGDISETIDFVMDILENGIFLG